MAFIVSSAFYIFMVVVRYLSFPPRHGIVVLFCYSYYTTGERGASAFNILVARIPIAIFRALAISYHIYLLLRTIFFLSSYLCCGMEERFYSFHVFPKTTFH
jgi:hypothetical protein